MDVTTYSWKCGVEGCKGMCLTPEARKRHIEWHKMGTPLGNRQPANTPASTDLVKHVGHFEYVTSTILNQAR